MLPSIHSCYNHAKCAVVLDIYEEASAEWLACCVFMSMTLKNIHLSYPAWISYWRGRISTIDLLVRTGSDQLLFILKKYFSFILNKLSEWGGHPYWAFSFGKSSLDPVSGHFIVWKIGTSTFCQLAFLSNNQKTDEEKGPNLSSDVPGNTNWGGRLSTVDLLIKVACFVKTFIIFSA